MFSANCKCKYAGSKMVVEVLVLLGKMTAMCQLKFQFCFENMYDDKLFWYLQFKLPHFIHCYLMFASFGTNAKDFMP